MLNSSVDCTQKKINDYRYLFSIEGTLIKNKQVLWIQIVERYPNL